MDGSLVKDLGLSAEIWLFLALLGSITLFFKFSRFWSVRNLDLILLFALAPGMMLISRRPESQIAYIWLFIGSGLWLVRCLLDLGLVRRPLLEPNLNSSGLLCLSVGMLGLLLAETVSLPVEEGAARNPAEPTGREDRSSSVPGDRDPRIKNMIKLSPLPPVLKGSAGRDCFARAGEFGASGVGPRPPGDRLAAFRAAGHGDGDGDVLLDVAVHADVARG